MSESTFEPNTFMTPNEYVDRYLQYLTGEEIKVLLYATRRILGFQKRQDHISLSLFTKGMRSKEGEVLDNGTGLSTATVKKCLASLMSFGLIVRVGKNDPKKNTGDLWSLQWKKANVNEKAMQEREDKKAEKQKAKMSKARSMRHTPSNGIEDPSPNGIEQTPSNGIETQNTGKLSRKKVKEGATRTTPRANDFPSNVLYREVTEKYPKKANWHDVLVFIDKVSQRLGRQPTKDDLFPFYKAWTACGWNEWSINWLEYAVKGELPHANGKQQQTEPKAYNAIREFLADNGVQPNG
jgi:predicted transcriptional regulator